MRRLLVGIITLGLVFTVSAAAEALTITAAKVTDRGTVYVAGKGPPGTAPRSRGRASSQRTRALAGPSRSTRRRYPPRASAS